MDVFMGVDAAGHLGRRGKGFQRSLRAHQRRLAIAQAIIHQPEFLILDEPASGLDPDARFRLSNLLVQLRDDGMTLLVSSHILSELEDYATHLVVLRDGRVVSQGRMNGAAGVDDGERLAITLAAACAVWLLWTTLRPFVRKVASACGMCGGCSPEQDAASPDPTSSTAPDDLLQIAPLDAG